MNKFLPGDRVINRIPVANIGTGTVVAAFDDGSIIVDWDNGFKNSRWSAESVQQFLTRQPVEPGCWVRSIHEGNEHIFIVGFDQKGRLLDAESFAYQPDCFVRIANPSPVVGMDLASGPDRTVFALFNPFPIADLKQAQNLAKTIHAKHFADPAFTLGDNLSTVLDQIDHMTAHMVNSENAKRDSALLDTLAEFIMHHVPGEPSREGESTVDCVIRVITEDKSKIAKLEDMVRIRNNAVSEAARLLRTARPHEPGWPFDVSKWLVQFDPQPAPVFKRGDLVTWGVGQLRARIIDMRDTAEVECVIMTDDSRGGDYAFVRKPLSELRRPE